MYAVIKTGGKQYRVKPGDLLVVEKLDGDAGAEISFDQVLAVGEGADVVLGAPLVAGASVLATLVETRKGEKIKIFKKRRRQGYRRTRGHRQHESVLRVTAIAGGGQTATWDGEVDLTPLAVRNLRARNLDRRLDAALTPAGVDVETVVEPEGKGKAPRTRARVVEEADAVVGGLTAEEATETTAAKPAKPAKAAAKKGGKTPEQKFSTKTAAPKPSKAQAKAPVRRSAPRGKG